MPAPKTEEPGSGLAPPAGFQADRFDGQIGASPIHSDQRAKRTVASAPEPSPNNDEHFLAIIAEMDILVSHAISAREAAFVVYAPAVPDLSAVKTVAGDYDEGQLADAMDEPKLVGDVIDHWLKLG